MRNSSVDSCVRRRMSLCSGDILFLTKLLVAECLCLQAHFGSKKSEDERARMKEPLFLFSVVWVTSKGARAIANNED